MADLPEQSVPAYLRWWRRFKKVRTPIIAVLATGLLLSSAVNSFGVPWQDILVYFLICLAGVSVLALAALLLVAIFKLLSRR